MSAAKNLIEGIGGMVDHINATHFKIGVIQAALTGEFEEAELRELFDRLDRARWRLCVLQNCVKSSVIALVDSQGQLDLDRSPVPEASPACVPRDHRLNGD